MAFFSSKFQAFLQRWWEYEVRGIERPNPNLTARSGFYFFHRGLPFCHYSFTNHFAITASRATHLCTPTIHACVVVAGLVALSTGPLEPLFISIGANLVISETASLCMLGDANVPISEPVLRPFKKYFVGAFSYYVLRRSGGLGRPVILLSSNLVPELAQILNFVCRSSGCAI